MVMMVMMMVVMVVMVMMVVVNDCGGSHDGVDHGGDGSNDGFCIHYYTIL
jgi:hypothetical protein